MAALSVGRSTVREVIRKLQALGVARIAQGQRHPICCAADLGRHHPYAAVDRHRRVLRDRAAADARRAARPRGRGEHARARGAAPPADLETIEDKLVEMERGAPSPRAPPGAEDLAFHLAIYDATAQPAVPAVARRRCAKPSSASGTSRSTARTSPGAPFRSTASCSTPSRRGDAELAARDKTLDDPRPIVEEDIGEMSK